MSRIYILHPWWFCIFIAAVIGLRTIADASSTTCPSSIPFGANFSSKGRFQDRGSLAFVYKDINELRVRGGFESDIEEHDNPYDNESDFEETTTADNLVGIAISASKKTVTLAGSMIVKVATESIKALHRAINAGLDSGDADESEDHGLVSKILDVGLRMVNFDGSIDGLSENESVSEADGEENGSISNKEEDFGFYLSKAYGVDDNRGDDGPVTLSGSLASALETARSQARMLVIFIPIGKPSNGKKTKDKIAIESILSSKVAQAANKRARKNGGETGSFLFWAANAGSSESAAAMKRLKGKLTSQKGEKRPLLAVAYPVLVSFFFFRIDRDTRD